ncbi:EndoU domain-containing protein [Glycomyces rhizosphaerae]|uniref:EndoU domain-containing protein n=1 Tax=Glycomyces rhizosphaerae TaxID=2054422 RepID=A0ABV7Q114_9ACTN
MGRKSGGKLIGAALDFLKKAQKQRPARRLQRKMDDHGLEHVFKGHTRPGRNSGTGYHYRPGGNDMPDRRIKPDTRKDVGDNGVYQAESEFFDSTMPPPPGQWKPKAGENGVATFFPDDWTPDQVDRSIASAFRKSSPHPDDPDAWIGESDGIKIMGYYDSAAPHGYTHGFPYKVQ